MDRSLWAMAIALAMASSAGADAIVHVSSDEPSRVSVDGEDIGPAPLTIRDMKPGRYTVAIENNQTGQVKTYAVRSPRSTRVNREFAVTWAEGEPAVQAEAPRPVPPPASIEPVAGAPVIQGAPGPDGYAPPPPVVVTQPVVVSQPVVVVDQAAAQQAARDQARNQTRAAVVGVAVADALFVKKKKTKKAILAGALGIGVLNEVLNR